MSDASDLILEPIIVRRMGLADIEQRSPWLIGRLQERYSEVTPTQIVSWLRGCMMDNAVWFVCSQRAVAMANVRRVPLETAPVVTEVFVLAEEGFQHEAADLYVPMKAWAQSMGASRLEVVLHSDANRGLVQKRIGDLTSRAVPTMKLKVLP